MGFTGKFFYVQGLQMVSYRIAFPNVNIEQELRMMEVWLEANPRRRKKNYKRFISNWLKSEHRRSALKQKEVSIGAGPSDHCQVRVRPEILERERKRQAIS